MWSAISKIFAKNTSSINEQSGENTPEEMDRRKSDMDETFVSRQAKQRASMKWLLSKAFNNKVPENLREPFYRDHENQEHLKPQIVGALANAEIYCMALGNIYSDPNYHNLNHGAIISTLTRKGVNMPPGAQLTETILIQTNPLRMSAHMAVVEMIMQQYAKEVITQERVAAAVQRFSHGRNQPAAVPDNQEQGLLAWVSHACDALRRRIEQEEGTPNGDGDRHRSPNFPPIKVLKDLCDGVGLAALISYYCPDDLPWTDLKISYQTSVQDCFYNLGLVQDFCEKCLPASIFHLMPEDITYMTDSMRQNLMVFMADLFNVMEIHPAKCVRYPGMDKHSGEGLPPSNEHGVVHKRNLMQPVVTPIPDLRSGLDDVAAATAFQVSRSTPTHQPIRKTNSLQQSMSELSEDSLRRGSEDSFVVHRGKNIPTLRSVVYDEPLVPARLKVNKERQNSDSKADERGEIAAGRPSNWEDTRKSSFAGRRSRRNSMTDDSQLTIENFGGSQDNLNFIGRNPDKEVAVHVGRKISAPSFPVAIENPAVRSSLQDARGSIQLGYGTENGCEKQDNGTEKITSLKRQLSSESISLKNRTANKENIIKDAIDGELNNRMSFADLNKQKMFGENRGIQLVYMNDKEEIPAKSSFLSKLSNTNGNSEKKTTFATLPNTTTWQQQSSHSQQHAESNGDETSGNNANNSMQLSDIRMKLEEKRRHIESEKRRMELAMSKQREKVGKAAFLQAVAKGKGSLLKSASEADVLSSKARSPTSGSSTPKKPLRPFTLQEGVDDISTIERKWLDESKAFAEPRRTPDLDNMDMETYQQSLAQMNSSLHEINSDMQRLASQHNQAMQVAQQQNLLAQQQRQIQALQQQHQQYQQQMQYNATPPYSPQMYPPQQVFAPPLQASASAPHIPQTYHQPPPPVAQSPGQFFLHGGGVQMSSPTPPPVPQRRTWAQQPQAPPQQVELRTWGKPQHQQIAGSERGGFVLHDNQDRFDNSPRYPDQYGDNKYQNGSDDRQLHHSNSFTLSQQHLQNQGNTSHYNTSHSTPSASPQHRSVHRQISQLLDDSKRSPVSLQQMEATPRKSNVTHAPIPAPPADDMEPQNISFIGNCEEDQLREGIGRLNITSGSRTYRIPSPTRLPISRNVFRPNDAPEAAAAAEASGLDADPTNQKGFYISFDDEQPKRPKPPLRKNRGSPKKDGSFVESPEEAIERREAQDRKDKIRQLERELNEERIKKEDEDRRKEALIEKEREKLRARREASQERQKVAAASAIVIGNDLSNPDPDEIDARERKKEKILMLSMQRKQQQEEARIRKEQEAAIRREREKEKEEEKLRKKEEQAARRQAILEQYKLKKAIDEAEREGKTLDRSELMSLKPTPKMRPKASTRPRPKTIHIDSNSVQIAEGLSSRGKKGSTSNLTDRNSYNPQGTMRRDYFKRSQDSLADRSMSLYKDSPDDSRGMSPCHSANQTLGRRSSYKTSRGSSTDQDSFAYRYGDTDSGLGRATPPRRAPSPGMGSMRHLPSPSGPGSLPGLMSRAGRRTFDDGSSDISSTSSMMDYNGPRLYKQPAAKSNRSIMLNAVEYCVFPGAVNREAKRRVLEEIQRSESKHFLILFRDAGCQFRALYSYCPDQDEVVKMYGTGPKQVNDKMFDKFFKYNSGGKCFSQIHTKHLTVTIDAFTIHNSLWQGKKVNLPNKKDMALVI
ncbi:unnamed protein product [Brassicogethes aeneus]|uniref:Patronin n=1 Tax=Brassicogethes aeneus TaxID=1431903 RepID=A0A9P0B876_BRAAE|nr:unnamed protein product [Brassicogethes aeneus]